MCYAKTPGFSAEKISIARSIKDQSSVLVSNEEDTLGRWRNYFKDLLNPVTIAPSYIQELHLGEENAIMAAKVFLAVKNCRLRINPT